MMQSLSAAVLSLFDLIHSESDLLRKRLLDTATIMLLLTGAAVAIYSGVGLLLMALFDYLQVLMTAPWPSLLTALLCFIIGGGFAWIAYRLRK